MAGGGRSRDPAKMAAAVRAGRRLSRAAAAGGELERAGVPRALCAELRAGPVVPFALLRRLHAALRDAGEPRAEGGPCGARWGCSGD